MVLLRFLMALDLKSLLPGTGKKSTNEGLPSSAPNLIPMI